LAAQPGRADQLWHDYHRTHDEIIKAELTRECMPMLLAMAEKVRGEMGGVPDLKDLVNAGVVGLLEAFERFDPSRGVFFDTFCTWRVLGAMHDDQRADDWAPNAIRAKAVRLRRAADEMANVLHRQPSDEELAGALDVSCAEVAEIRRHADHRAPLSIDRAPSGEAIAPGAALEDRRLDPAHRLLAEEARTRLLDTLKALPDKQRYVLLLYYFERLTMAQIGLVLGVSESRVCQLHREALTALVRRLGPRKDEFLDALGV
jgi:RNA polymerase sigma factor for flagellar operon FliA